MSVEPKSPGAARRVAVYRIESILRAALALPASEPASGEELRAAGRRALSSIVYIDGRAWLAWALAGLRVFSLPRGTEKPEGPTATEDADGSDAYLLTALTGIAGLAAARVVHGPPDDPKRTEPRPPTPAQWMPSIRAVLTEARHLLVELAMLHHGGNISRAAAALGTSRRALRDSLKAAGLYSTPGRDRSE